MIFRADQHDAALETLAAHGLDRAPGRLAGADDDKSSER
jgi:hypothetical protein